MPWFGEHQRHVLASKGVSTSEIDRLQREHNEQVRKYEREKHIVANEVLNEFGDNEFDLNSFIESYDMKSRKLGIGRDTSSGGYAFLDWKDRPRAFLDRLVKKGKYESATHVPGWYPLAKVYRRVKI